jgi:hypothetical protein
MSVLRCCSRVFIAALGVAVFGCSPVGACVPTGAHAGLALEPGGSFAVSTSSDQAGGHPDLTTSFAFAQNGSGAVGGILRNVEVVLPIGFAGYPTAVKTCSPVQLELEECPADSQVGTIEAALRFYPTFINTLTYPVYNMAPPPGETAVFGFVIQHFVSADIVVSVSPDYRVRATVTNAVTATELTRQSLTLWGVPADSSHNAERGDGYHCEQRTEEGREEAKVCIGGGVAVNENPAAFLVNPTQCPEKPLEANLKVESWEGGEPAFAKTSVGPYTGCESLKFAPTISVQPEQTQATTPTGYEIDLNVPQTEGAEGLATADLQDAVIKMPKGVVLSPSAANGLVACSEAQIGLGTEQSVECPNASKLGEVSLVTPALTGELKGFLYLGGTPSGGPITEPPFTVYLTLAGHGVLIKIKGSVVADEKTGQLTTTFEKNPELPFSELKVQLNGGSRATVANPSVCGAYSAESELTPWSFPYDPLATPSSFPFEIEGCQPPRFAPSFVAGATSNQAGGYSPLSVTFSREDADEDLGGLTVTTPPGLSGNLSKVPLCGEPQAAQGTCPEASQIGEVTAGVGPGPEPLFIKGGKVYLTGPYDGAPFGLSVAISEHAGPFDFGTGPCDCEVVRATVNVDPHTAQLTVSNGALPEMKYGIPFQVKTVNVTINRPEFVFNPTSCEPMNVGGTLLSTQGASAQVSSHFQATNCAALAFKPTLKASTSGHTSRAEGASLTFDLTYPHTPQGTEANIARFKVELPKGLPSRLKTLQKACVAATFEADPASCPATSVVGHAKAITPIIPVPLEGPAYFVSHGGEAFPSLVIVLQGYGVTVDLVSTTFISKHGVTSGTVKTVPDVPVGSFELTLPEGPHSALAAPHNLCKGTLKMPTEFLAQNGAAIHQNTTIKVAGCPKGKAAHRTRRTRRRGKTAG